MVIPLKRGSNVMVISRSEIGVGARFATGLRCVFATQAANVA